MHAANIKKKLKTSQTLKIDIVCVLSSGLKSIRLNIVLKLKSLKIANIKSRLISTAASLTLLKANALNADLKVPARSLQKFIKKKEVSPIISQPKKNTTKLPALTKIIILNTNAFIKEINLQMYGSYLKYENV